MNLRFKLVLATWLACVPFAMPTLALADPGQPAAAEARPQASMACPVPATAGDKLNVAQTIQTECCKDHKGVCGCRAGKIICCDGTASTVTGCTCHGDDGFLE